MTAPTITGAILAGGLGRRMAGNDKGLQTLHGKPMVLWAIERLRPQVDTLLVNANRNLEHYRTFGYPVCPDLIGGFAGPLAGLHAALSTAGSPLVAAVPCDSPFLPHDLVARLHDVLATGSADIAVARCGDQVHRAICLCKREVLPSLTAFLESGGRKVEDWYDGMHICEVHFDDCPAAFANINSSAELALLDVPMNAECH